MKQRGIRIPMHLRYLINLLLTAALWAVLGILVTVFIQAGMYMLMAPVGIATLTGPFCITTWLFLLPLVRFDDEERPDHSNWYPENKKHLAAQQPGAKTE